MESSQLQALNFKVKSIQTFLGILFTGETIEDKNSFVERHWEERVKATDKALSDAYEDYVSGK